ncbi:MAG: DNA-deoxyinosine glycosylase [Clostridiales bacterium]|nr:DNA-deoxyinosine glycosylase [Clostridiales bacterium]
MFFEGFEPFINTDSRVLILGSFPSVKSREEGFYYGNRQNRFWRVLADFFGCTLPNTIEEKKQLLTNGKIALWDIVISCEIVGSMDKDIRSPRIADIPVLLKEHPISSILTNGKTAHKLFLQNFPKLAPLCVNLPSTSPANGRFSTEAWLAALKAALTQNT